MNVHNIKIGQTLYRHDGSSTGDMIFRSEYKVTRLTKTGYFVDYYGTEKYINHYWKKKFAHVTITESFEAFKARQRKRAQILHAQLARTETLLSLAKRLLREQVMLDDVLMDEDEIT